MNDRISRFSLTLLVVASMVGAGVYTTSGYAIGDLGNRWLVMATWLIAAGVAMCGAVSYGMLADRLCENGGEYLYLSRYAHRSLGFVAGWVSFLAGFTGAGALAAIAFDRYAWPIDQRPGWLPPGSLGVIMVLGLTAVHVGGGRRGVLSQNAMVIGKLVLLAAFIIIGWIAFPSWSSNQSDALDFPILGFNPWDMATTVMWVSLSYTGFNAAIYVAGQTRTDSGDVRRAMIDGTLAVTVIYLLLNAVFVFAPDPARIAYREDVATVAAMDIGGPWLALMVRAAILIGLATSVSSILMTGPRVYAKMAEDGYFPAYFAAAGSATSRANMLQGLSIVLVVFVTGLPGLLSYLGLTLSLCSAATVSTLAFHRQLGQDRRVIRWVDAFPIVYVISTLVIATMATINRPVQAIATLVTIIIGLSCYAVAEIHKRQPDV